MSERYSIHIGTSGWNYQHWSGAFYPEDLPPREWLKYYSERFHTVEVNNSFYQLPEKSTFENWSEQTPGSFSFAVKANRYITHMKKLKDPRESLSNFLGNVRMLGDKLGPILFQLPPNWNFNAERLDSFLDLLPDDLRYTFEFRDHSWITENTYSLLEEKEAAFCIYELAGYQSPIEVTSRLIYLRLHGPGEKYQGKYDHNTLAGWAEQFVQWSDEGREIYCYFDNDQLGYAALNAMEMQEILYARIGV